MQIIVLAAIARGRNSCGLGLELVRISWLGFMVKMIVRNVQTQLIGIMLYSVAKYCSGCSGLQLTLYYDIPTYSVITS